MEDRPSLSLTKVLRAPAVGQTRAGHLKSTRQFTDEEAEAQGSEPHALGHTA